MPRRKRILILGAGFLGRSLASTLARDGHEVTLVDADPSRLDGLEGVADLRQMCGSATSLRTLREAGAASADAVVALTGSDSTNALICGLARSLGARACVARIRDVELAQAAHEAGLDHIGIDHAISPEGLAVEALVRIATAPGCVDAIDLADGRVALRAFIPTPGSPVAGRTVAEVRAALPGRWLVAAIGGTSGWSVPGPAAVLAAGEPVYICAAANEVAALLPAFDPAACPARRVAVIGAGAIGEPVARRLAAGGLRVLLLEADATRAQRAALDLDGDGVEVLAGALTDADLVLRAGIGTCDVLLATGEEDQDNLMVALLARARGVKRVVAIANHEPSVRLMASLDLDAVVSPLRLAASAVSRVLRGRSLARLARLSDEHLEFLELTVPEGAAATNRTLRHLGLPRGCLVLAVVDAQGAVTIPGADTRILPGERVVTVCANEQEHTVTRLFGGTPA